MRTAKQQQQSRQQPTILYQPQINFYYPPAYPLESPINHNDSILSHRRSIPQQNDFKTDIEKRFKQSRTNKTYIFPRRNLQSESSSLDSLKNTTNYDLKTQLKTQPQTQRKGCHLRIKTEGNQPEYDHDVVIKNQNIKIAERLKYLRDYQPTKSEEKQKQQNKMIAKQYGVKAVKQSLSPMQPTRMAGSMTDRKALYLKSEHQPDILRDYQILKTKQQELMTRIKNQAINSNTNRVIQKNVNLASHSPFHQRIQTMQDEPMRASSRLKTEPVEEIGYQVWQKRQQNYFYNKKTYNK